MSIMLRIITIAKCVFTALICGVALLSFTGCYGRLNEDLREMVESKPHDERLYGWWKVIDDEHENYICFDDKEFRYIHADYLSDGTLNRTESSYWYTEGNVLYLFRQATPLTGIIDSDIEYSLSEDLQTFYEIFDEGERRPSMARCSEPSANRL